MADRKRVEVTAGQAFEGLFEWFKAHPWMAKIDPKTADMSQEIAARQALLLLRSDDVEVFRQLPLGVQGLAAYLLLDFMARLSGPWAGRTWIIEEAKDPQVPDLVRACWLVIEQEIHRANPPPSARH